MDVIGWILLAVGAFLFLSSLVLTLRANADARIPVFGEAPVRPRGAVLMRSVGAGFAVLSAAFLVGQLGVWSFVPLLGVLVVGVAAIAVHNLRVATARP